MGFNKVYGGKYNMGEISRYPPNSPYANMKIRLYLLEKVQ
jgi:hypothetical protein